MVRLVVIALVGLAPVASGCRTAPYERATRRINPDMLSDTGPNYKAGLASVAPGPSKFYIQNGSLLEVKWY